LVEYIDNNCEECPPAARLEVDGRGDGETTFSVRIDSGVTRLEKEKEESGVVVPSTPESGVSNVDMTETN